MEIFLNLQDYLKINQHLYLVVEPGFRGVTGDIGFREVTGDIGFVGWTGGTGMQGPINNLLFINGNNKLSLQKFDMEFIF